MDDKTLYRRLKIGNTNFTKNRDEFSCYGRVGSSCSTSGTHRGTHKHLTISRERRRMGLWLQQAEDIYGHLWHRYSVTVNQVIMATVKLSKLWLQLNHQELLGQWLLYKQQPSIKEIMVGTTIFRCMSKYEADLDVSVVLFISSSIA